MKNKFGFSLDKMSIGVRDLLMYFTLMFPILMVVTEGILTKLCFAIILGLSILVFANSQISLRTFLCVGVLMINYAYSFANSNNPIYNINLYFYYPFFVIFTCIVDDNADYIKEWFYKNKNNIDLCIFVWTIIVGFSTLLPSCYYIKEGGARYFGSFCGSIFRLGQSAAFIQALVIAQIVFSKKKKYVLFMFLPMFCFVMGSSRTYLVVGTALFGVACYLICKNKRIFYLSLIPFALAFAYVVLKSSMGEKIMYTLDDEQYGDFWYRITSSRSEFWVEDLTAWGKEPFINKLLGARMGFTHEVSGLWGHNDFIEIICSYGIVGVLEYTYIMFHLINRWLIKGKKGFVVISLMIICWLFNASFNMYYTYFCCMLSFPLAVVAIGNDNEKDGIK